MSEPYKELAREKFEKYCENKAFGTDKGSGTSDLRRKVDGDYANPWVQIRWAGFVLGFQAASPTPEQIAKTQIVRGLSVAMTRGELNAWLAPKLEQAARQIAEIWGVKGSKDFDEECILGILRETIKGKP